MNNKVWVGLELAALPLIFAPEPVTTFAGIALLAYARKKRLEQQEAARHPRHYYSFHDYYNCRVGMVNRSAITYNIAPIRRGQLPMPRSTISNLYESRREWEAYHKTVNLQTKTRVNISRPLPQQPAGLLQTPVLRYQKIVNMQTKTRLNISCSSSQQPAGLLQTPVLRYQSGLRPRRVKI